MEDLDLETIRRIKYLSFDKDETARFIITDLCLKSAIEPEGCKFDAMEADNLSALLGDALVGDSKDTSFDPDFLLSFYELAAFYQFFNNYIFKIFLYDPTPGVNPNDRFISLTDTELAYMLGQVLDSIGYEYCLLTYKGYGFYGDENPEKVDLTKAPPRVIFIRKSAKSAKRSYWK